jgi:alcohol dehydrogenase
MHEAVFSFHAPTEVRFGVGTLDQLKLEMPSRGWQKALVITDDGVRRCGQLEKLEETLKASQVEYRVYDGVQPNPTVQIVHEAFEIAQKFEPDVLIGFGGGSSLDAAKVVNILKSHGGHALDYEGGETVPSPCGPLLAIPTTAGTGSEVTIFAVVSDPQRHTKLTIASKNILPTLAIVDPKLTLTMPVSLTAATGLDAFTHAVEAMTSIAAQPLIDLFCSQAIKLIHENLPKVCQRANDVDARSKMAFASLLGGLAISNSFVGVAHSIAHALGGLYDLPHGVCCALALPPAMEFNLDYKRDKYEMIASTLGAASAEEGIERVRRLNHAAKIPTGLHELGIRESEAPRIAQAAMADGSTLFNPRPLSEADMLELVRSCF